MKRSAQNLLLVISAALLATGPVSLDLWAQDGSPADPTDQPPDTFREIELSSEGVIAYDSTGRIWMYDFTQDRFVPGDGPSVESGDGRELGFSEESIEPVEMRCVIEKAVDFPAIKAVYIGRDEYVDGDVLAYGRVTIKGWVKGNVQSFNTAVLVTSTGQVDGTIKAPEVVVREGGVVLGRIIESPRLDLPIDKLDDRLATAGIWVVFAFTLALGLIVFLSASLAPRQMTNLTDCVQRYPTRSFLLGFLFLLLMPVILILVLITVVGVLVVPIAYLAAMAFGMSAVGHSLVRPLARRYFGLSLDVTASSLGGVFLHMAVWTVVALLLGTAGVGASGYHAFGVFLLVVSIIGTSYSFLTGIGAAVLTRFGYRAYVGGSGSRGPADQSAPAPAPPPIPQGPATVNRPPGSTPGDHPTPRPPRPPEEGRTGPLEP